MYNEIPITNDIFKLYGQDLFLFTTKPIVSVITYEAPIAETIAELRKRISECLKNPPPSLKRLWIRQIDGNMFKYYQDTTVSDILQGAGATYGFPPHPPSLYGNLREQGGLALAPKAHLNAQRLTPAHMTAKRSSRGDGSPPAAFHIYAHPHIKQLTIIANHAFWDGLALMNVLSVFCGLSEINISIPTKPYDRLHKLWDCVSIIGDVLPCPNQLTVVDREPRYETVSHCMSEIKTTHKSLGVSMPSHLLSLYLKPLFERLPTSIQYLKVFVPYYLHHPNRFNSHGVVPILVFRNKLDAREIDASLKRQRPMLYGMEEILELHYCRGLPPPCDPPLINDIDVIARFKPDIVFSIIKSTNETGYAKLKQMSVLYNTRDMGIYVACIQTGDEMTMSSSLFCNEL
jgi:hypothetical protein